MTEKDQLFWLFFSISGRLGRTPYFLAGLLVLIVQLFLFYQMLRFPEDSTAGQLWSLAFLLAAFVSMWSNFALTAKRLHDFGKSAAFALVTLFVGFVVFIALSFVKGDPGPNQYGARTNAAR